MSLASISSLFLSVVVSTVSSSHPATSSLSFDGEVSRTRPFSALYGTGHLSDFAPVIAGFVTSDAGLQMIFMSEDPDYCASLNNGQPKRGARSLLFALKNDKKGMYGADFLRFAWDGRQDIVASHISVLDDEGVDIGDARNLGQPSIMPFGMGVVNTGWLRLDADMEGDTLSGEYSVGFGTEGYPTTALQGRFSASRCHASLDRATALSF